MSTIFKKHQKRIALDSLKMIKSAANIMGGMSHKDAYLYMLNEERWKDIKIQDYMRKACHTHEYIQKLMKEIHISKRSK